MPILDLQGAYGSDVRPARLGSERKTWARDPSAPGASDGTRVDATFINDLVGMFRSIGAAAGVSTAAGNDDFLRAAVVALANTVSTNAINALLGGAPGALDALNELAAALGNDPNFAATMASQLALKAPLASPTLTGTPSAPTPAGGDSTTKLSTTSFVSQAFTQFRWLKTAAGGETSLSGNDDTAIALAYVPGTEAVFKNGTKLRAGQYVATTGTSITGLSALTTGDKIELIAAMTPAAVISPVRAVASEAALRKLNGEEGVFFDFKSRSAAINDFTNAKSWLGRPDDILPITRASTASYVDRDRILKFAPANTLRYVHDPLTGAPLGAMFGGGSTNLFDNSVGITSLTFADNVSTSAASALGPERTMTMGRLTSTINGGSNNCYADRTLSILAGDTTPRRFSVFLRKGNTPTSAVNIYYASGGTFVQAHASIDWTTFAVSGSGDVEVVPFDGGLYRVSIGLTGNGTANTILNCRVYVRSNGTSNVIGDYVDVDGWQCETGYSASSYIKTTGASASRAADANSLALALLPFSAIQGTLYVKARLLTRYASTVSTSCPIQIYGAGSNYIASRFVIRTPTLPPFLDAVANGGGTTVDSADSSITVGAADKQSLAYRADDVEVAFGGAVVATDNSISPLPTLTTLNFGGAVNGSTPPSGAEVIIEEAAFFTRRFTAAEAQALTA